MTQWNLNSNAPKDRPFLCWGWPSEIEGMRYTKDAIHLAYWDDVDSAYCIKGATWMGPFIVPKAWAEEPAPPVFK